VLKNKSKFIIVNSITGDEDEISELVYYYSSFYRYFWIDHISFVLRPRRRRFSRPTLEEMAETLSMYLAAHDVKDPTRKRALLLYCAGEEVSDIRNTSRSRGRKRV